MISIIDYGAGNLRSVQNTLAELGASYKLIDTPEAVLAAEKLVLPGVGHFGQLMVALDVLRLREAILEKIRAGNPFFGICLGMQALFSGSGEAPDQKGLALYPERIERFPNTARVPHMGWNSLTPRPDSKLLRGLPDPIYVYFANSYYAPPVAATAATCDYQFPFSAVVEENNVYGVQFHPEKSGATGLKIMSNFLELA
ncbi:imidazole glycerol phosphate synthase subunit HisH [Bryobacter aggregatus]|uniref:imidazole glycerol phosphate synthase subunit HisH n=1 Tax=Bryobacter aggregatus TaxID=360054 RepID=UPI0004E1A47A|nr:imidazole glycerol phosphate synthase subunit HisH [Bryobacter aggregatus]